jgi:hypothetical protein
MAHATLARSRDCLRRQTQEKAMMQRALTRAVLATLFTAAGAAGLAIAADRAGAPAAAAAPVPAATAVPAPPAPAAAPAASGPAPTTAQAAAGPSAQPAAPATEAAIEARRKEYEERVDGMQRREPNAERREAPEGVPSREDLDRYVEQRRQEVDAQLRATDPWGQARRDWLEGRRQFRRDTIEMFRGAPGFPGAYPYGPLAPYYGARWGNPIAPMPPTREGMDEFFENKHRAIEEQFRQATPWTAYGVPGQPARDPGQDWMLRQNPWVPTP